MKGSELEARASHCTSTLSCVSRHRILFCTFRIYILYLLTHFL